MTTRLTLVCHAATVATRVAAFPADEPLDAAAAAEIRACVHRVPEADRCWTAPARRTRQTAEALGIAAASAPDLDELDYGRWTGRSVDDIRRKDPGGLAAWLSDPQAVPHGGEALAGLIARVSVWLDAQGASPGAVVAVTHASVIRAAILHAIGAPSVSFWRIDVAPLSAARLSGLRGRWTLQAIGPLRGDAVR